MSTRGFDGDLDAGLDTAALRWRALDDTQVLITGARGFVGTVLLHSVEHAHRRLGTGPRVVALVRDTAAFHERISWAAAAPWLRVVEGDVRRPLDTSDAGTGRIDYVIHAANTLSAAVIAADPTDAAALVEAGTRYVYAAAVARSARAMLQVSSGSVVGEHHAPSPPIREDDPGEPRGDSPALLLAQAKRRADDWLVAQRPAATHGVTGDPRVSFARGFAMCGPWLPLHEQFAFGNFIRDALAGGPVIVGGDGSPVRSFLYASDLAEWLWTILLHGAPSRAYNVGSGEAVTIGELAARVAAAAGVSVRRDREPAVGASAHWHVPDISRARDELGLRVSVGLDVAIARTLDWWRAARPGATG